MVSEQNGIISQRFLNFQCRGGIAMPLEIIAFATPQRLHTVGKNGRVFGPRATSNVPTVRRFMEGLGYLVDIFCDPHGLEDQ